jgi:hypothetical protein
MANDPQVASGGHPTDVNLEDIFTRTGFCVVPDVLGADEVATMRDALDADRAQHDDWAVHGQSCDGGPIGESGRWQGPRDIMRRTSAFDRCVGHPRVAPLLGRLLGPSLCLTGGGAAVRDPVLAPAPGHGQEWPTGTGARAPWPAGSNIHWQMFHREEGGSFLPTHRLCINTVQVRWQLDDTDASTHCITIVPESLEEKKALLFEPRLSHYPGGRPSGISNIQGDFVRSMWRNQHIPSAVDCTVCAGSVIIMK